MCLFVMMEEGRKKTTAVSGSHIIYLHHSQHIIKSVPLPVAVVAAIGRFESELQVGG